MKYLEGKEKEEAMKWFDECAKAAQTSLCLRAHCAAVIVKDGQVIGEGPNGPPQNNPAYRTCLDEYDIPAGFRHDRTCCIHAEQRAILNATRNNPDKLSGARIYFVNIDQKGDKMFAQNLKCTICSRAALDAGIIEFALLFEDGVHVWDTDEYNRLSYQFKTPKK